MPEKCFFSPMDFEEQEHTQKQKKYLASIVFCIFHSIAMAYKTLRLVIAYCLRGCLMTIRRSDEADDCNSKHFSFALHFPFVPRYLPFLQHNKNKNKNEKE